MLDRFLEPIQAAEGSLAGPYRAYRMDDTSPDSNMRGTAGLGTCNCCDYFVSNHQTVFLIEETRLPDTVKQLRNEYHYLEGNHQQEFISKCIRQENRLKVYGSMLVLSRLALESEDVKDFLRTGDDRKKYQFWLVVSGMDRADVKILFQNLRSRLLQELRSVLAKETVEAVEIIPFDRLAAKLEEHAATIT